MQLSKAAALLLLPTAARLGHGEGGQGQGHCQEEEEGEEDKWQMKMKEVMSGTDWKMEEMLKELRMLRAELKRQEKTHSEML